MKEADEIQQLKIQIEEWGIQLSVLSAKKEAAAVTAKRFADEFNELRGDQQNAIRQLRELELHQSGMYMWENIGDGG